MSELTFSPKYNSNPLTSVQNSTSGKKNECASDMCLRFLTIFLLLCVQNKHCLGLIRESLPGIRHSSQSSESSCNKFKYEEFHATDTYILTKKILGWLRDLGPYSAKQFRLNQIMILTDFTQRKVCAIHWLWKFILLIDSMIEK